MFADKSVTQRQWKLAVVRIWLSYSALKKLFANHSGTTHFWIAESMQIHTEQHFNDIHCTSLYADVSDHSPGIPVVRSIRDNKKSRGQISWDISATRLSSGDPVGFPPHPHGWFSSIDYLLHPLDWDSNLLQMPQKVKAQPQCAQWDKLKIGGILFMTMPSR